MKISLKWLNEYVEAPNDIKALCDTLDLTGTGVEGVETLGELYDKVVTGQIIEKKSHENADTLWVTKVDVGEHNLGEDDKPEPLQIVCGAQNFETGDHVVVSLVGAVLPGDFKIKKSKIRGVVSCGMNCSERELGLGTEHDGIMILSDDAPIGMPFAEYLGTGDTVLDLEITPNRPDCLSVMGMARELGAIYKKDVRQPTFDLSPYEGTDSVADKATVEIADETRCNRYTARIIKNVKVGPSPSWLAERVTAAGARPINNIVDVTNYIMFLLGQPLHAFDYDKVKSADGKAHIIVRPAREGETFTTLDEENRTLKNDMTVIATPERAVALAGVMGGLETEVTDTTTTILLEAATFSPAHTSRTSRNLGLISESSMRYERGVDDNPIQSNSEMAAALIAEVSGGEVCQGMVDTWSVKTEPRRLDFRINRFNARMGTEIPDDFIVETLTRLGCAVAAEQDSMLSVIAPTFRPDLQREIDLYEEVLRIYGMDEVEPTLPGGRGRIGVRTAEEQKQAIINDCLRASGLNETMTYSFAEPTDMDKLRMSPEDMDVAVELINPINAEQSVMRQNIIPGLLRSVAYNQNHGVKNIQLYEIGSVFQGSEGKKQPKEKQKLAAVMAGAMTEPGWNVDPQPFDFFDGKGVVENIMRELAIPKVRFKEVSVEDAPHLQPGRAAEVWSAGALLGWVGELHPLAIAAFEAEGPVVAFEFDLNPLIRTSRDARDYRDIPVFPAVSVDVAFVVDEGVAHERMEQSMGSAGGKLLESIRLFDVYRDDEKVGVGKKSMAYALTYRASDRTLTGEEIDKTHERLISKVQGATGAEVRS